MTIMPISTPTQQPLAFTHTRTQGSQPDTAGTSHTSSCDSVSRPFSSDRASRPLSNDTASASRPLSSDTASASCLATADTVTTSAPQRLSSAEADQLVSGLQDNLSTQRGDALSAHGGLDMSRAMRLLEGLD